MNRKRENLKTKNGRERGTSDRERVREKERRVKIDKLFLACSICVHDKDDMSQTHIMPKAGLSGFNYQGMMNKPKKMISVVYFDQQREGLQMPFAGQNHLF